VRRPVAEWDGAVRRGELLLAGLLRCGHCGRKLHVAYSGKIGRYNCYGARANHGTKRCLRLAAGYVKAGRDRIEKDPDQRVRDAMNR
jgi:hypothetical protein